MRLQLLHATTLVVLMVCINTFSALGIPKFLRPKEDQVVSSFVSGFVKKWQLTVYVEPKIIPEKPGQLPVDQLAAYQSKQLKGWLKHENSTYDVWVVLQLDKVPLDKVYEAPTFGTYARYVNMFDDYVMEKIEAGDEYPVIVAENSTPAEMATRAVAWALERRSDDYVKLALQLTNLRGEDLTTHANYKYYEMFLIVTKQVKS